MSKGNTGTPEVVDPETFDELAATGEITDVQVEPEPGESQVPGNFEDSTPTDDTIIASVADDESNPDVAATAGLAPDFYAEQEPTTHLSPYADGVDPEVIAANADAYKEAAEHAAKANSEA